MTLTLTSVSAKSGKKSKVKEKTLIEHGLSLASLMKEKASSKAYLSLFSSESDALLDKTREISAGDVSKPTAVYRITGEASAFLQEFVPVLEFNPADISPSVRKEMEHKFFQMIANIWTAGESRDTYGIAAASLLAATTAFDSDELSESCLYVFTFEEAYPVAVSFEKYEGHAVIASATYVLDKDFIPSFKDMLSKIKEQMDLNLKIEEIQ